MSIRLESVTKRFETRVILDDVSLEIPKGEIVFILGKSGMGKSVSLKLMMGFLAPDAGKILIEDSDISEAIRQKNRDLLFQIRQSIGMVFQHPALLDDLSLFENVAFGLRVQKLSEIEIEQRVFSLCESVGVDIHLLSRYPHEVGYGVQKRVSIARTLAPRPQYVLYDEPTTGLDPESTLQTNALIEHLSKKFQVTSVVVSHDMSSALKIAHRILFLDQGRILFNGSPKELLESKIPILQDFVRETVHFLSLYQKKGSS